MKEHVCLTTRPSQNIDNTTKTLHRHNGIQLSSKFPKHQDTVYLIRFVMTLWLFIFVLLLLFVAAQSPKPALAGGSMSRIQTIQSTFINQIPLPTPSIASKSPVIGAVVLVPTENDAQITDIDPVVDGPVARAGVAGTVVQRINCGSVASFTDDMGMTWEPDSLNKYFDRGKIYSNFSIPISNTKNDWLYQTERTANGTVTYNIPVISKGAYSVELHFAEIYFDKANRRLFDIVIEGQAVTTKYDVWKRAGGKGIAIVEVYAPIIVADHLVTIQFVTVWNQIKISAIVIRYMNDSTLVPRCSPNAPVPTTIVTPVRSPSSSIQFPQNIDAPNVHIQVPTVPVVSLPIKLPVLMPMVVTAPMNAPTTEPKIPLVGIVPSLTQDPMRTPILTFVPVPVSDHPVTNPLLTTTAPTSVDIPESGPTVPFIVPVKRLEPTSSPVETPSITSPPTAPTPLNSPVLVPTSPVIVSPATGPALGSPTIYVPINATPVISPDYGESPVIISPTEAPILMPSISSLPTNVITSPAPFSPPFIPPAVSPIFAPEGFTGIRINCGGETYIDTDGNTWEADTFNSFFNGGYSYSDTKLPIQGTLDGTIYQSERTGTGIVSYTIGNLPFGYLVVKLHFAEIYWNSADARLFDIYIEGVKVAAQYDVWSKANGQGIAVVETFNAQATQNEITITFNTILDQMKVSAIEIIPLVPLNPVSVSPSVSPRATSFPTGIFEGVYINSGGSTYTDTLGNLWEADIYYSGGYSSSNFGLSILETDDDILYQSERAGSGIVSYSIPSLPIGIYEVKLHFAELYQDAASLRLFDISIEGNIVAANFDIWAEAGGKGVAIVATYKIEVIDGILSIDLIAKLDESKISGICVHSTRDPTSTPSLPFEPMTSFQPVHISQSPSRPQSSPPLPLLPSSESSEPSVTKTIFVFQNIFINCGAGPYNDSIGRSWEGDIYYNNGYAASNLGLPITNTIDDFIYQTERTGSGSLLYEIPVPVGEYRVELHFAEIYWDAGKSRLMDIKLQDSIVATSFDVWTTAGGKGKRIVLEYTVLVESKYLKIEFDAKLDQYTISGMVVQRQGDHLAHAVAGGPYAAVDIDCDGFGVVSVDAFQSHTHGLGLVLTKFVWRFNGEIVALTQQANLTIPVGSHTITLVVEDDGGNSADTFATVQIFDLGFPFIDNLSPSSGDVFGGTEVMIHGSGFNWTQNDILVQFGDKDLKGSDIVVIDEFNIKINGVPGGPAGMSVQVVVKSPIATSNPKTFTYYTGVPIEFTYGELVTEYGPTTITVGPDGILYVGTLGGDLLKIALDDDLNVISFLRSSVVNSIEGGGRSIMGIAFDPLDVGVNPKVYVSHSYLFHGSCEHSAGLGINGKMSVVSGANLDTIEDIVTGLPVSDHDHAPNGIHFGDNGEMYMMIGGNTNAGVPGGLSGCGEQKENFFSGACLKFDLKRSDFDGFIEYDAVSGNVTKGVGVEVFAPGFRNPWDVVLHSNGYLYSTDNGPNKDYGKKSVDCDNFGLDPDFPDELNVLLEDEYYGHANRKRGEDDHRQCMYFGLDTPSIAGVRRAPLLTFPPSSDGIVEWETEHFNGQLRGNLIVGQFVGVLWRVILSQDGLSAPNGPIVLDPQGGLDVTQGPDGTLFVADVGAGKVTYLIPDEAPSLVTVVKASWPRRGPLSGGNVLTVYGELLTLGGNPKVSVGGSSCFIIAFTETKVKCIIPSGFGKVDVILTSGSFNSTLHTGYRYISG